MLQVSNLKVSRSSDSAYRAYRCRAAGGRLAVEGTYGPHFRFRRLASVQDIPIEPDAAVVHICHTGYMDEFISGLQMPCVLCFVCPVCQVFVSLSCIRFNIVQRYGCCSCKRIREWKHMDTSRLSVSVGAKQCQAECMVSVSWADFYSAAASGHL